MKTKYRFIGIITVFHASLGYCLCLDALRAEILSDKGTQNKYVHAFLGIRAEENSDLVAIRATPRESPLRFDLSEAFELSERLFDEKEIPNDGLRLQLRNLSKYEFMILSLRIGDEVVFGDKVFKLGEFLGRGNTTHVWALADDPEKVIRIPFNVGALRKAGVDGVYNRNKFMIGTYDALAGSENAPEIYDFDLEYHSVSRLMRYMVVQRVHGSETGADLIRKLSGQLIDPESERSFFLKQSLDNLFSSDSSGKFELLVRAMRKDNAFYPDNNVYVAEDPLRLDWVDPGTYLWPSNLLASSRQYLWDERLERWFLVDGN